MSDKSALKLDWCSHAAAKYAVERWHYSRTLPPGKAVRVGVWEYGIFQGVVLFSYGANRHIGRPYHLAQTEVCECTRIALGRHQAAVSRIGSVALRMLHRHAPGLRLVVSYADPQYGHYGGIYQAMGWIYVGRAGGGHQLQLAGQVLHKRVVSARYGTADSRRLHGFYLYPENKYKYLYALDAVMCAQILPLAQPYPKRATSILADAPTVQVGESGAAPTVALGECRPGLLPS